MFNKNDIINTEITALSSDGLGIGRVNGFTFFVKNALPSEKITAQVIKLYKSYGIAKLLSIDTKSAERVAPPCECFNLCGGCTLQHLSYASQCTYKSKKVADALRTIGKIPFDVTDCAGMSEPYRYRNKVQFPFGKLPDGSPAVGYFRERTHDIAPVSDCIIARDTSGIVKAVLEYVRENGISVYDEKTHTGILRHLVIRTAVHGTMVCLVINAKTLPRSEELLQRFKNFPEIKSVLVNINTKRTNLITGDTTVLLQGDTYITDVLCELSFKISLGSFYQINPSQTEKLYNKVLEYAKGGNAALDLYCGIGTISLLLAKKFQKVQGVEIVKDAVDNAVDNAKLNKIGNVSFVCGKSEEISFSAPDVVVVDPPRKGCEPSLLSKLDEIAAPTLIYVSCNPATLARDISLLKNYKIDDISVFDCFPQTPHVESVALLSRL
ncbi:putative RNA methyltransferase [Clostridia bacterium]|nr:putative RNA methyltransferase [Clostridia bacterium]